jgi:hypothetical protein
MTVISKIINNYKAFYYKNKTKKKQTKDNVNHPSHYTQGVIECIDAIKEATKGLFGIEAVCTANIIKYVWRWKFKNGLEDLDKASWYLERLKQEVRNNKK